MESYIIADQYKVVKFIRGGACGTVYSGEHLETGSKVAIKFEREDIGYLPKEYSVYKEMQGVVGTPDVYWFGIDYGHNILVMELLGPSVHDLLLNENHKLPLGEVFILTQQLLTLMEKMHSHGTDPLK